MLEALCIVLIVAGWSFHELGHALACRYCCIPVKRIALFGWYIPGLGTIRLPIWSRYFPEAEWVVHPLLVGAYMVPDEVAFDAAPRKCRYLVLVMGPIASIGYGLFFLILAQLLGIAAWMMTAGWGCRVVPGAGRDSSLLGPGLRAECVDMALEAALYGSVLAGVYLFRQRGWFHFLLLLSGCLCLPIMMYLIYAALGEIAAGTRDWKDLFPGMVGMVVQIHELFASWGVDATRPLLWRLSVVAYMVGYTSCVIGVFNMSPMLAGDGTMILMELFPRHARRLWSGTVTIIAIFVIAGCVSDAVRVWSWLSRAPGG